MAKNVNGRFKLVDSAYLHPGESLVSKTPNGPFIDTGVDLSGPGRPIFRGRVYLAVEEIREMAEQAGLFDPYEQRLEQQQQAHEDALSEAEASGYARGYAERVDAAAIELVDRMRARVAGGGAERAAEPTAAGDDPAAGQPAESGAEAAGVEGLDDVPGAEPAAA